MYNNYNCFSPDVCIYVIVCECKAWINCTMYGQREREKKTAKAMQINKARISIFFIQLLRLVCISCVVCAFRFAHHFFFIYSMKLRPCKAIASDGKIFSTTWEENAYANREYTLLYDFGKLTNFIYVKIQTCFLLRLRLRFRHTTLNSYYFLVF